VQIITRSYAVIFFVLCCILLFYVKLNKCSSYCLSWTGFAPLQVWFPSALHSQGTSDKCGRVGYSIEPDVATPQLVMASTIINEAFVYMPADTDASTPILQARHIPFLQCALVCCLSGAC